MAKRKNRVPSSKEVAERNAENKSQKSQGQLEKSKRDPKVYIRKRLTDSEKKKNREKQRDLRGLRLLKQSNKKARSKLRLISKRGTRVSERRNCDLCGKSFSITWRYLESSRGVVYLCLSCKASVPREGDRKLDALDFAKTGGIFEGNKKKH